MFEMTDKEARSLAAEQAGMDAQRDGKPRIAPANLMLFEQVWWLEGWDFAAGEERAS